MEADVVQKRAEAKDYLDLDALIGAGYPIELAIAAAPSRGLHLTRK